MDAAQVDAPGIAVPDAVIVGSAAEELSVRRLGIRVIVQVLGIGDIAALAVMIVQLAFGGSGMNAVTWNIAALVVIPLAVGQVRAFGARRRDLEESVYRLARFAADNDLR
ncbi:MAG: hypothetical protein QM630_02795 [Microbacterium sp.]